MKEITKQEQKYFIRSNWTKINRFWSYDYWNHSSVSGDSNLGTIYKFLIH